MLQAYGGYVMTLGGYEGDLDQGAAVFASTHSDVVQDPLEFQRLVLPLHGGGIQAIAAVDELDDVARGAAHCQVVLRAQILQRLDQAPLQEGGRKKTHKKCSVVSGSRKQGGGRRFGRSRYLHVARLGSFHGRVHQTLATGHGVEEKLSGRQAGVEAVGNKAFSCRQLPEGKRGSMSWWIKINLKKNPADIQIIAWVCWKTRLTVTALFEEKTPHYLVWHRFVWCDHILSHKKRVNWARLWNT